MRVCLLLPLTGLAMGLSAAGASQTPWIGFAGDAQHTGRSMVASKALDAIVWKTKVDLYPPYSNDRLLIHYGSPVISGANTVVVPTKIGPTDGFRVTALSGAKGAMKWNARSTYTLPPHNWYPSFNATLVPPAGRPINWKVAWPESGGRTGVRDVDTANAARSFQVFYGAQNYAADPAKYDTNIKICTPITAGPDGSLYFGFIALGDTPLGLKSGLAKIGPDGKGKYVAADVLSNDADVKFVKQNGAPAISNDGNRLYIVVCTGSFGRGMLVELSTVTLQPLHRVALKDPASGLDAHIDYDGTSSPVVGPNNDVFVGVLENAFFSNHLRGWMLHFNSTLTEKKTPGAFGWDNTPSIVPKEIVPFYKQRSPYLLFSKYNNYAEGGGGGRNKIALLDPFNVMTDPVTGITVMKEVATQLGPTHDARFPGDPGARVEWCINAGVVDIPGKCLLANSEDGMVYRWDLVTNKLSESIRITPGLGQAYTCTLIGPDGKVYAVNNALLFAIGVGNR